MLSEKIPLIVLTPSFSSSVFKPSPVAERKSYAFRQLVSYVWILMRMDSSSLRQPRVASHVWMSFEIETSVAPTSVGTSAGLLCLRTLIYTGDNSLRVPTIPTAVLRLFRSIGRIFVAWREKSIFPSQNFPPPHSFSLWHNLFLVL